MYERKDERPLERWYVECTGFGKCDVFPHTYPATKLEAIEAWNTRAERTCRRMPADDGAVMVMRGGLAMEFPYFECSECGAYVMDNARYCPNCGAKVVEE